MFLNNYDLQSGLLCVVSKPNQSRLCSLNNIYQRLYRWRCPSKIGVITRTMEPTSVGNYQWMMDPLLIFADELVTDKFLAVKNSSKITIYRQISTFTDGYYRQKNMIFLYWIHVSRRMSYGSGNIWTMCVLRHCS